MPAIARPEFSTTEFFDSEMADQVDETANQAGTTADREAMKALQYQIATAATFETDGNIDGAPGSPVVVGVDQAFTDGTSVSAAVAMQDGDVIDKSSAHSPIPLPYIPGLLAFREGPAIEAALADLAVEPDYILFDGSGRIHYRQAGIAVHMGVVFDVPAIGVAKSLLCGEPKGDISGLDGGDQVPIYADESVSAPSDTMLGYALQTRQFQSENRYVNPVYVSPGHRIDAHMAADRTLTACAGYKLPEPIRRADSWVNDLTNNGG